MADSEEKHYTDVRVLVYTTDVDKPYSIISVSLDDSDFGDFVSMLGMTCPGGDTTSRTASVVKWCVEHKMKRVSPSLVTQIIIRFADLDETLRLIE